MLENSKRVIQRVLDNNPNTIITTSFGDQSAALIHLVQSIKQDAKFLWVDTGWNTPATVEFANRLISKWKMNIAVYRPLKQWIGSVPRPDTAEHLEFAYQMKLEPFERAFTDLTPQAWITDIRRNQTQHRQNLKPISRTETGILKVAPFFTCSHKYIQLYMKQHSLPNELDYFDPIKGSESRECGLHTIAV